MSRAQLVCVYCVWSCERDGVHALLTQVCEFNTLSSVLPTAGSPLSNVAADTHSGNCNQEAANNHRHAQQQLASEMRRALQMLRVTLRE